MNETRKLSGMLAKKIKKSRHCSRSKLGTLEETWEVFQFYGVTWISIPIVRTKKPNGHARNKHHAQVSKKEVSEAKHER